MKKIFLIIAILVASTSFIIAQTEPQTHKNKIQYLHAVEAQAGYNIFVDNYGLLIYATPKEFTYGEFHHCWSVGLHELHGVQFNPHLSLAAVLGMNFLKMYPNKEAYQSNNPTFPQPYPELYILKFNLGLNFKYTILKNYKWSPFLAVEICPIGVELQGIKPNVRYANLWQRSWEGSIAAGAHYRFKDRQSVYVSMGYELPFSQLFLSVGVRLR